MWIYILQEIETREQAWRAQAHEYAEVGLETPARILSRCADELAAMREQLGATVVAPARAARLTGYSTSQLRRLRREGRLSRAGSGYRLIELPVRPRENPAEPTPSGLRERRRRRRRR